MNEAELVAALKSGDPAAVEEVVRLYGDRLLRSAFLLCGNEADAQDLVQDTLILAVRRAHRFRGESALYTWLYGILLNLTRHYHRKRKRIVYTDQPSRLAFPEPSACPTPSAARESQNLDIEAASSALMDAIHRLSPVHREVIILRYYEGMKVQEIARHIGVTKGTVASRLHYAKRHLRRLIPKELNLFRTDGTYDRRKS
jgi:RNA polymerase sigma-70 factor (ECF subfamily)